VRQSDRGGIVWIVGVLTKGSDLPERSPEEMFTPTVMSQGIRSQEQASVRRPHQKWLSVSQGSCKVEKMFLCEFVGK